MNKKDDFFEMTPSEKHDRQVLERTQQLVLEKKLVSRRNFVQQFFIGFGSLATLAVVSWVIVKKPSTLQGDIAGLTEFDSAFCENDLEALTSEDLEMLNVDGVFSIDDLEILEGEDV